MSEIILGSGGYLPQHQRNLEHLTLITDWACQDSPVKVELRYYRNLKSLNWRGLRWHTDSYSVNAKFIRENEYLEELVLDYGLWATNIEIWSSWQRAVIPDNLSCIMHELNQTLGFNCQEGKFHSLKRLRLAAFLIVIPRHPKQELRLSSLRLLSLWNCPRTDSFLIAVVETATVLNLTTFELVRSHPWYHPRDTSTEDQLNNCLPQFLLSFGGLENVYLLLATEDPWPSTIVALARHQASLKRLVLHYNISANLRSHRWFERVGRDADIPGLSALTGFSCVPGLQFLGLSNCLRPPVSFTA